ncbi:MAG: type II secretion system protein [Patescibacteria group bacterium]
MLYKIIKKRFTWGPLRNAGFTLIELLVVISIIGLLSSMAVYAINSARLKARDIKRLADLKQIQLALELFYDATGYYPEYLPLGTVCNATTVLNPLVSSGFLSSVPIDPKNVSSPIPRLCYYYMGIGAASDYGGVSGWYCSGRPRTDYQYTIHFSTEVTAANYPRLTNSAGVPNNEYTYCIPGPLR